jgi:hypothetical protein
MHRANRVTTDVRITQMRGRFPEFAAIHGKIAAICRFGMRQSQRVARLFGRTERSASAQKQNGATADWPFAPSVSAGKVRLFGSQS